MWSVREPIAPTLLVAARMSWAPPGLRLLVLNQGTRHPPVMPSFVYTQQGCMLTCTKKTSKNIQGSTCNNYKQAGYPWTAERTNYGPCTQGTRQQMRMSKAAWGNWVGPTEAMLNKGIMEQHTHITSFIYIKSRTCQSAQQQKVKPWLALEDNCWEWGGGGLWEVW